MIDNASIVPLVHPIQMFAVSERLSGPGGGAERERDDAAEPACAVLLCASERGRVRPRKASPLGVSPCAGRAISCGRNGLMPLLEIRDLTVAFPQADGVVQAVRGASFAVEPGESLGIVGESGSGKSVTCMAALRLLREPPAQVKATTLTLDGVDMLRASRRDLADMRGRVAAMVFQDPMTAFDPVYTIGRQIAETVEAHRACRARPRWPRRERCSLGSR